ncbi:MAG: branched-chain amino acid ABC transporter permease [Candidatus Dormibacteraeota bacterium]|nr:branched-chain amino acid ABC transporter permease [Candidatus Dormibacteraeota bacterium]
MSAAAVVLVGGVVIGSFYALVGLGFGLLHGIGETNLGYGDGMVLSAFVAAGVTTASGQPLPGLAAGLISGIVLALATERLALRPLLRSPSAAIVATTGLALVWRNASQLLSSNSDASVGSSLQAARLAVGGVPVDAATIIAIFLLAVALAAVILVPRRTGWGRRARAVGDDRLGAALSGVAVERTIRPLHVASGAIGAVTGLLLVAHLGVLSINIGWQVTLVGFVAATVGGRRGPEAAAIGGLALGVLQTAVQVWVGSIWAGIASLAVLALVLVARPTGLLRVEGARP